MLDLTYLFCQYRYNNLETRTLIFFINLNKNCVKSVLAEHLPLANRVCLDGVLILTAFGLDFALLPHDLGSTFIVNANLKYFIITGIMCMGVWVACMPIPCVW